MYDFTDKKTIGIWYGSRELNLANPNYVPFSLLFTLGYNYNYPEFRTIRETTDKNKERNYKLEGMTTVIDHLKIWLDQIPCQMHYFRSNGYDTFSKLYKTLTTEVIFRFTRLTRDRYTYMKGYYTLINNDLNKCYFMLVIKKEYIRYVKLCVLLNEPIMEDCYEFWYDEQTILEDPDHERIKKLCTKLLKDLKAMDIPCFNKNNMLDLFKVKFDFTAPTIAQQKEAITKYVDEFQASMLEEYNPVPRKLSLPRYFKH